jgi:hemerythrin-like domain-containing protein
VNLCGRAVVIGVSTAPVARIGTNNEGWCQMPQGNFDGREMLAVHNVLRREFSLMSAAVGKVAAGDRDRAHIIGEHIAGVSATLHEHHHAEDRGIWPLLLQRCGNEVTPLVEVIENQHRIVATHLSELGVAVGAWREDPTVSAREILVRTLGRLLMPLKEHLRLEEDKIVPLMEKYITADEANEVFGAVAARMTPDALVLLFGMVMYEGDPDIIDGLVANMPPELSGVIRPRAQQAFTVHSQLIHGTSAPSRSIYL